MTTRCRGCGYTHFYRFNLEYMARCPIDGEEVSAPRAP
jgi:predicted nucleic-acid-binding Zn-ribbon protein